MFGFVWFGSALFGVLSFLNDRNCCKKKLTNNQIYRIITTGATTGTNDIVRILPCSQILNVHET